MLPPRFGYLVLGDASNRRPTGARRDRFLFSRAIYHPIARISFVSRKPVVALRYVGERRLGRPSLIQKSASEQDSVSSRVDTPIDPARTARPYPVGSAFYLRNFALSLDDNSVCSPSVTWVYY